MQELFGRIPDTILKAHTDHLNLDGSFFDKKAFLLQSENSQDDIF